MNEQGRLDHDDLSDGEEHRNHATVVTLLLLGSAMIAAPLLRHYRGAIDEARTRAITSGRQIIDRVVDKLPGQHKE